MFEWVLKVSIVAVLFTVISYVLPKSNIRNASMFALSFVFLSLFIMPLSDFTTEITNRKIILETEKNELINQIQGNTPEKQVMEHYKNRIKEEIEKALEQKKYACNEIIVTVDENVSSESFGRVLNIVCNVTEKVEEKKEDSLKKIKVPNIVIDRQGIRIEKEESKVDKDMKVYENEIKDIVFELTGTDKNKIIIRWSE